MSAVVIIGASQGLGEALCEIFHKRGKNVVGTSRNEDKLQQLSVRLPGLKTFVSDVTKPSTLKDLMQYTINTFGGISTLIFASGVNFDEVIADWRDTEIFRQVIEINLIGAANSLHAALPYLSASPNAQVVAITSLAGIIGCVPGGSAYAASKAEKGMDAFFCSVSPELKALGINVLIVDPGSMISTSDRQVLGSGARYKIARANTKRGKPVMEVAENIVKAIEKKKTGRIFSMNRVLILGSLFLKYCLPSIFEKLALRVRFKNSGGSVLPERIRYLKDDDEEEDA